MKVKAQGLTITVGEFIDFLEKVDPEHSVKYDFGYMVPTTIDSWRGIYAELALGYAHSKTVDDIPKVAQLLTSLKECIGKVYQGYKGGHFQMGRTTPLWVDNWGEYSQTVISKVVQEYSTVVIRTKYKG